MIRDQIQTKKSSNYKDWARRLQPTNWPTDGQTPYRDARTHLKMWMSTTVFKEQWDLPSEKKTPHYVLKYLCILRSEIYLETNWPNFFYPWRLYNINWAGQGNRWPHAFFATGYRFAFILISGPISVFFRCGYRICLRGCWLVGPLVGSLVGPLVGPTSQWFIGWPL